MHRISGQKNTAGTISIGEKQVLSPFGAMKHFIAHRHADDCFESVAHLLVGLSCRMERPVTLGVLHDQKAAVRIDCQIVSAFAWARAERQSIVELIAAVESLAQPREVSFTTQA